MCIRDRARVVRLIKDKTGLVRTVHVWLPMKYTKSGRLKLKNVFVVPVQHVVPLEIYAQDDHYQTRKLQINKGELQPEQRDSTPERDRWLYLYTDPKFNKEENRHTWTDANNPNYNMESPKPQDKTQPIIKEPISRKRGRPPKPKLDPIPADYIEEHEAQELPTAFVPTKENTPPNDFMTTDFFPLEQPSFEPDENSDEDLTYYQREKIRKYKAKEFYAQNPRRSSRTRQ